MMSMVLARSEAGLARIDTVANEACSLEDLTPIECTLRERSIIHLGTLSAYPRWKVSVSIRSASALFRRPALIA